MNGFYSLYICIYIFKYHTTFFLWIEFIYDYPQYSVSSSIFYCIWIILRKFQSKDKNSFPFDAFIMPIKYFYVYVWKYFDFTLRTWKIWFCVIECDILQNNTRIERFIGVGKKGLKSTVSNRSVLGNIDILWIRWINILSSRRQGGRDEGNMEGMKEGNKDLYYFSLIDQSHYYIIQSFRALK